MYAMNNGIPACDIAEPVGLTAEQVEAVYRDIESKRKATRYLHLRPQLVEEVEEVASR